MQRTPAGLPFGMPGIGELIEGAVQQAPQPGRQETDSCGELMNKAQHSGRNGDRTAGNAPAAGDPPVYYLPAWAAVLDCPYMQVYIR